MLKIRLARTGKKKRAFFRIVLTEHTKPAQSGYKSVLWFFDPIKKDIELDVPTIKKHIANGAKPSERVARLAYNYSKDDFFKTYFIERTLKRETKNPDKFEK